MEARPHVLRVSERDDQSGARDRIVSVFQVLINIFIIKFRYVVMAWYVMSFYILNPKIGKSIHSLIKTCGGIENTFHFSL